MTDATTAARARFAALLERPRIPLDEAALAIAAEVYPDLDPDPTMATLDAIATRVGEEVGDLRPPLRVLQAMRTVLRAEGFRGNEKEYYDPRNSFLNEVVARKLGIPITLSLVTIEVARRLGLELQGVGRILASRVVSGGPADCGDRGTPPMDAQTVRDKPTRTAAAIPT